MTDMVNNPPHYNNPTPSSENCDSVETIDAIEAMMTPQGFQDYCRGNAVKYLSRCQGKGTYQQDLKKAQWYLNRALASCEADATL